MCFSCPVDLACYTAAQQHRKQEPFACRNVTGRISLITLKLQGYPGFDRSRFGTDRFSRSLMQIRVLILHYYHVSICLWVFALSI